MGIERELAAMRRRLNKIVPQVQPPALKLHVIGPSDAIPATTAWEMVLRVESKNPAFDK